MGKIIREIVRSWICIRSDPKAEALLRENDIHFKKVDVIDLEELTEAKLEAETEYQEKLELIEMNIKS